MNFDELNLKTLLQTRPVVCFLDNSRLCQVDQINHHTVVGYEKETSLTSEHIHKTRDYLAPPAEERTSMSIRSRPSSQPLDERFPGTMTRN